jgi:hypothetical protein
LIGLAKISDAQTDIYSYKGTGAVTLFESDFGGSGSKCGRAATMVGGVEEIFREGGGPSRHNA